MESTPKTFYVTFADPKSGTPVASLGPKQPGNPRCFAVTVQVAPGMDRDELRMTIFAQADQMYLEYIRKTYAATSTPRPAPKAVAASVVMQQDEPELVFDPSEITPFIDQAMVRWLVVAGRGIRLELAGHGTASTDCVSVITINPEPLLEGFVAEFDGMGLHETGHIRWDREGTPRDSARRFGDLAAGIELLQRAREEGGEVLQHILNLIMDRRVDWVHTNEYPGNAHDIWYRLGWLLPGEVTDPETGEVRKRRSGIIRDCKESVFTDFVYACKKHTKAQYKAVYQAVGIADRAIRQVNAGTHKYAVLLTAAKRVLALLREHQTDVDRMREEEREEQERAFGELMKVLLKKIRGGTVDPKVRAFFRQLMAKRLATKRQQTLSQLPAAFQAATGTGTLPAPPPPYPSQGAGGQEGKLIKVKPNAITYQAMLRTVRPYVQPLRDALQQLAVPDRQVIQGLIEGEFDIEALPVLVTGRPDVMKIELRELKLSVALSVVLDVSGSMIGAPVETAKGLGVCFNEAIMPVPECIDGWFWAFDHDVYECGPAGPNNGIASVKGGGGTSEAFALRHAAQPVAKSTRLRKIVVVVCDGFPNDPDAVREEVQTLMRAGILPIRILVGVDAAPGTYPVELLFDNWTEFYRELGTTFGAIFQAARA